MLLFITQVTNYPIRLQRQLGLPSSLPRLGVLVFRLTGTLVDPGSLTHSHLLSYLSGSAPSPPLVKIGRPLTESAKLRQSIIGSISLH